jgi:hypothetical protein
VEAIAALASNEDAFHDPETAEQLVEALRLPEGGAAVFLDRFGLEV